jgi:beta-lactamase class A
LYNATYISNEDADYALSLLVQTKFHEGLTKWLPADLKVAHKFGEWGEPQPGSIHQLHETGIVYLDNGPYLIDVMTKGNEPRLLANVIADISKLTFERLSVSGRPL